MLLLCCSRTSLASAGQGGVLPGHVDGHHITAGCSTMHRHSWVFSSTSVMLSSCLHSRFVLSLHFAYRLQLMLSSCFQSAVLCVCVFFCVVISLTSFMLSSCLRSLFQFCILVFHVVSAMASTLMSPRRFEFCMTRPACHICTKAVHTTAR